MKSTEQRKGAQAISMAQMAAMIFGMLGVSAWGELMSKTIGGRIKIPPRSNTPGYNWQSNGSRAADRQRRQGLHTVTTRNGFQIMQTLPARDR